MWLDQTNRNPKWVQDWLKELFDPPVILIMKESHFESDYNRHVCIPNWDASKNIITN